MTPVARLGGRGYAARVSRLHFHRWAAIFLLVSKLILGQFAHAMPHMAESTTAMNEMVTSLSHDSPPCGDHVQTDSASGQSQDSGGDHAEKSCCKGGECACPCLHSPAAVAAVLASAQRSPDDQVGALVHGVAGQRLSDLFRPPA